MSEKEYDPHLNIEPLAKAKDTQYLLREIEIEHSKLKLVTPFKILDGKNVNKNDLDLVKRDIGKPIFESWANISNYRTWNRLKYLLEEAQEDKISGLDGLLGLRKSIWDESQTTTSLVFAKNPFTSNTFLIKDERGKIEKKIISPFDKEDYFGLLDYLHSASRTLILSPDIRIKKLKSGQLNIEIDDYSKFVDDSVKILSNFNKTPIFVPIQIQLNNKQMKKILEHYRNQNYTNIWIDFNASHIGGTHFSRVRALLRLINETLDLNNVVLYYSHIKKEMSAHNPKDEAVTASDILSQFFAAGFIGISRSPQIAINETDEQKEERIKDKISKGEYRNEEEYKKDLLLNQRRIFDSNTYYYYKLNKYPSELPITQQLLLKKEINQLFNSVLLYNEVENTKRFVQEQKQNKNQKVLLPYIKNKKAFEDHDEILKEIAFTEKKQKKDEQKGLFEFLGEQ